MTKPSIPPRYRENPVRRAYRELCNAYAILQDRHGQRYKILEELDHVFWEAEDPQESKHDSRD